MLWAFTAAWSHTNFISCQSSSRDIQLLRSAMARITNSSIQIWLDFNYNYANPIPPMTHPSGLHNDTYASICTQPDLLINPGHMSDLATCGLWATLVSLLDWSDQNHTQPVHFYEDHLRAFTSTRLDYMNRSQKATIFRTLSGSLSSLYLKGSNSVYYFDEKVPFYCSDYVLFSTNDAQNPFFDMIPEIRKTPGYPLSKCMEVICSPRSVDPDLDGVGVRFRGSLYAHCWLLARSTHPYSCKWYWLSRFSVRRSHKFLTFLNSSNSSWCAQDTNWSSEPCLVALGLAKLGSTWGNKNKYHLFIDTWNRPCWVSQTVMLFCFIYSDSGSGIRSPVEWSPWIPGENTRSHALRSIFSKWFSSGHSDACLHFMVP